MNATAPAATYALPEALEAEQQLLGAILIANDAMHAVSGFLKAEHFVEPIHGRIYELCAAAIADGRKATAITIGPLLPPDLRVGDYSPMGYLGHLTAEGTTIVNAPDYARAIAETALRRDLMALAGDLSDGAANLVAAAPIRDQLSLAELRLLQIGEEVNRIEARGARSTYASVLADVGDRMRTGRHLNGVSSGLAAVDARLGGFAPGDITLIGARPSMGKTAIATSMARRQAHQGIGVGFVSLEMSREKLILRLLADECETLSRMPYKMIGEGRVTEHQLRMLDEAGARLEGLPLYIGEKDRRLSDLPGHIRAARKHCEARGVPLGMLYVDYVGLLEASAAYRGKRYEEVTEISGALKALAIRESLPIVGLHQLNRQSESRNEDRRPKLSELRDSGALEQDADVVLFVHRESYYLERPGYGGTAEEVVDKQNQMDLIIAKNRQGPIGSIPLWCDMPINAVRDTRP